MNNNDQTPVPVPQGTPPAQPSQLEQGQEQAAAAARAQVERALAPQADNNPYHRTHKDNFDWRTYHSAWQQYYQQYYQRYYTQQLHAAKQKLVTGSSQPAIITGSDAAADQKTKIAQLKQDITDTVKEQAKKVRHSHHFVPIASAVVVGLVFLFLQFNSLLVAHVRAYVSPGAISSDAVIVDPATNIAVGPEPKLVIPKINVDVPVDYAVTTLDERQIQLSLRDGATHYKLPGANAVPGQNGNTVILGHSSNDIFNQGAYKFVFVLLDRLEVNDTFQLNYNGVRYVYRVTEKRVIDPRDINALIIGTSKPMATLITCTPPGTALQRLLIYGEQVSPDPKKAQQAAPASTQGTEVVLPGNEPSWLDNLWGSIF